jgi:tight adherence protein B
VSNALFESAWGTFAVGLTVGCVVLVATLVVLAKPRGAWLRGRLDPYGRLDGLQSSAVVVDASPGWRPQRERLYGATERVLESTRAWGGTMRLLERAGAQVRPVEFAYMSLLAALVVAAVAAILFNAAWVAALGFVLGALAPTLWMHRRARRRLRAFEEQLADVLMTMSSSLKVGLTFTHSMAAIVEDGDPPVSEEFERVLTETQLGRPMDDALAAMAKRVDSEDVRFVLMSVMIQREVGGSLGDLFHTVSETVRERQQFRRKVRALTAMGRMSAYLLIGLPFVVAGVISLLSPGYITPLFSTGAGRVLIVVMLGLMGIGSFCLKRIVTIKG